MYKKRSEYYAAMAEAHWSIVRKLEAMEREQATLPDLERVVIRWAVTDLLKQVGEFHDLQKEAAKEEKARGND